MKMSFLEWLLMPEAPGATVAILLISMCIAFVNSAINRLLIARFVGWEQYKVMQKEIREYRFLSTQALRTRDKKLLDKLKKEEPKILQMQKKMLKPQLAMFMLSLSYIFVWVLLLIPTYGASSVAYIPGVGWIGIIWWYPLCSFLFGIISSRVSGLMTESE